MAVTPGDGRSTAAKLQDLAAAISAELRDARTAQTMAQEQARLAAERNTDLIKANWQATKERDRLLEDIDNLRAENRDLVNPPRARITYLETELMDSHRINANLREKVRLAVDDGTAYKQALDVARQGIRNLQAQLQSSPLLDVIQLQEKNTNLLDVNEELRAANRTLANKVMDLEASLNSLHGPDGVYAKNANLASRNVELATRVRDLESGEVVNRELVIEWRDHERQLIAKYNEEAEYGLAALHVVTRKILNKILTNEYPTR